MPHASCLLVPGRKRDAGHTATTSDGCTLPVMRITLPFALLAAVALPALAGEASGEFTVSKRPPIRPKYAAAYETRDQRDAHKRAIEVVLSDGERTAARSEVTDLEQRLSIVPAVVLPYDAASPVTIPTQRAGRPEEARTS